MLGEACAEAVALVLKLLAILLGRLQAQPQRVALDAQDADPLAVLLVLRDEAGDFAISPRAP